MKKISCLIIIFLFLENYAIAQTATILHISDTRSTSTTPTTYSDDLIANFKMGSVMGLPSNSYYYGVIGLRAWGDNSGGPAHELAFSNSNDIFVRYGYDNGWGAWSKLITATDVNGDIQLGNSQQIGTSLSNSFTNSGINQPHYGFQWVNDPWSASGSSFWLSSYGGIKLFTAGTPQLSITWAGNIGIGTTNPQSKLSVNGTITGKQVTVIQTGWSDFVFDKMYKLPALSSTAKYIKDNHHLPGIPSAKQIESKGLNLGDMEQKQMQKIEELTLYQIEANKRINHLEKNNKALRSSLNEYQRELSTLKVAVEQLQSKNK